MSESGSRRRLWVVGALAAVLAAGSPAFAQGGAHGGGSGGGHFGGGGHASGGHYAGGGHVGAGAAHLGGSRFTGVRAGGSYGYSPRGGYAPRVGYAPRANFSPRATYGAAGGHVGVSGRVGAAGRGNFVAAGGGRFAGRPGVAYSGYGRPGYRPGFRGGYGRFWGGGYWHGAFWPRVSYGWGFPLFLGVLPAVYATYYWGGIPYYYANDVYYTWDAGQNGYVVTDPPPVEGTAPADDNGNAAQPGGSSDVYAYPQNNQSDEQQSNDRYECHDWARSQTGFDPTHVSGSTSGNAGDYRRAMVACLSARGYSAQ